MWLPRPRPFAYRSQLVRRGEAAWIGEIPVDGFGEPGFEALCCFQASTFSACEGSIAYRQSCPGRSLTNVICWA